MPDTIPEKIYKRELVPNLTTLDEKTRTVSAVIATSNPVEVYDWERGLINESIYLSGMRFYETDKAPLIDSHNSRSTKNIIGTAANFRIEGTDLLADVTFASTPAGEEAYTLLREGHLRKLSIGYQAEESVFIEENTKYVYEGREYEGPLKLTTKSLLLEVSIVSIPADVQAEFRSKNEGTENKSQTGERTMPEENKTEPEKIDVQKVEREAAEKAQKAERERIIGIRSAASMLGISDEETISGCIDNGTSLDETRKLFIEKVAASRSHVPNARVGHEEADTFREIAPIAFSARMGMKLTDDEDKKLRQSGFQPMGLQGLARCILSNSGIKSERMSNYEVAKALFERAKTSDFVNVLANVFDKSISIVYQSASASYRAWTKVRPLSDFRAAKLTGLGPFSYQTIVTEGTDPNTATLTDAGEDITLKKLHDKYVLSFEAITNDDTGAFSDVPANFGLAAINSVNRAVYLYLMANAAIGDTKTMFHADRGNLVTGGDPISINGLDAGLQAMVTQKVNNVYLNMTPRFIIVTPKYMAAAEQLVSSAYDPSNTNGTPVNNVFGSNGRWRMQVISDANLADSAATGYDSNQWFLAADPMYGGICIGTLNGQETPIVTARASQTGEAAGVIFDSKFFYAVACGNPLALYKNDGGVSA